MQKKEVALDLAQFGAGGPKGDPGDRVPRAPIEGVPAAGEPERYLSRADDRRRIDADRGGGDPGTSTDRAPDHTPQTAVYCGTSTAAWAPLTNPQLKLGAIVSARSASAER